ncbi:MAG TPA: heavy metal-binding domain-containing protein [Candidatus Krumholzibacteria bacterium]|nr:heavy metal-binding domain-containing protein [Candidatus Krumholzibacteria bacterium]HPD72935.1 heavy metal-binding domain-containing protein [Candidatus Krumholzibacteria bacterium]HRY41734.1 heavy metal-binding domain-containing protein [Candidatus Krumholzibacteria bacterium]
MRESRRIHPRALLIAAACCGTAAAAAAAQTQATAPLHGGTVTTTRAHAFETVLAADGLRVFLFTGELAPAMVEKARGTAHLALPGGRSVEVALAPREPAEGEAITYFCPMHAPIVQSEPGECKICGGMVLYEQDYLFAAVDLAGVDPAAVKAMVRITGLRGAEKEATFSPAFPTPARKAGPEGTGKRN